MYLPFIMWGYAVALALLLVACQVIPRSIPGLRGIRELRWAIEMAIACVLLISMRPWAPAFLSIVVGNYALFTSFLLVYRASALALREKGPFLPWGIALCCAVLPPFCYYTWIHPDILARILLSSGTLSVLSLGTAVLLLRQRSPELAYSARTIAGFQISTVAVHLSRSALSVLHPPADFVHGDWIQTGFTWGQLILCVATCCGIIWLSVCEHRGELESMAQTDPLTRLLNRRAFEEILDRHMQRSHLAGATLGLILVDLDHFKQINDRHGHAAGDEVIRRVSSVLTRETRPLDALARYGGEEFVVLLPNVTPEQTENIAERLRAEIELISGPTADVRVTASIGVATTGASPESPRDFLERCDQALYRSKRAGRNVVTVWSASPDQPSLVV